MALSVFYTTFVRRINSDPKHGRIAMGNSMRDKGTPIFLFQADRKYTSREKGKVKARPSKAMLLPRKTLICMLSDFSLTILSSRKIRGTFSYDSILALLLSV